MSRKKPSVPETWTLRTVSGVAEVNPRMQLPPREADDVQVPLYEMAAIDEARGALTTPQLVSLGSGRSGRTKFTNGDVLFAKITPCVQNGKSAIVEGVDGAIAFGSSEFYVLRAHSDILPHYLFYFLRHPSVVEAAVATFTGTSGRQRVPSEFWDTLQIPVPPLPVQELIVAVLNKADEIRSKREAALDMAEKLLPAMFRDLFGDPDANPHGWPVMTLGEHLLETRYGTSERTGAHSKGDPVLRIPNVVHRTINTSELKYLRVTAEERRKLLLQAGDILVVRTNGNKDYVGRAAVFDLGDDYLFASYLIRLRLDTATLNPHYVVAFLATPFGRGEIDINSRTSAGQFNISATGLRSLRIPVPPLSRQLKFLAQYEQWKQAQTTIQNGLKDAHAGFAALMSQAFAGKLTAEFERVNELEIANARVIADEVPPVAVPSERNAQEGNLRKKTAKKTRRTQQ